MHTHTHTYAASCVGNQRGGAHAHHKALATLSHAQMCRRMHNKTATTTHTRLGDYLQTHKWMRDLVLLPGKNEVLALQYHDLQQTIDIRPVECARDSMFMSCMYVQNH